MEKQRVSVLKVLLLFVLFSVGVMTFNLIQCVQIHRPLKQMEKRLQ